MKVAILAGGLGSRISEETEIKPKPMVEIGGRPILWHIMKIYSAAGITDFVVLLGYKGYMIKEYFANYFLHMSDVTIDIVTSELTTHATAAEPWRVTIVDTGEGTMTGGRVKRLRDYIGDETFCMTYGDCAADIDIGRLVEFHRSEGALATLTAVQPPGRFGVLRLNEGQPRIESFTEKPDREGGWVNGGFFVVEPEVLEYVEGDATVWEREPMERLALEGNLSAYRHEGFWHPMDTLRDKVVLEELWASGKAPWKIW